MSPSGGPQRSISVVVAVVAVVVLVAALAFVLFGGLGGDGLLGGGDASEEATPRVLGEAHGITIRSVVLTDAVDPTSGSPGPSRDTFAVGEPVTAWVAFDYRPGEGGTDVLRLVWSRGDSEELFQSTIRMPQPIDHATATLGATHTSEPGTYVVRAYANDTELTAVEFTVGSS